jgi:hypothetical protein
METFAFNTSNRLKRSNATTALHTVFVRLPSRCIASTEF